MIVDIKGTKIFIKHKVRDFYHKKLIVDDLLDDDESIQQFKDKHKIQSKVNITRFTDVKIVKG